MERGGKNESKKDKEKGWTSLVRKAVHYDVDSLRSIIGVQLLHLLVLLCSVD